MDYDVGALRYLTCQDGQRDQRGIERRDRDGLVTQPHTHDVIQAIIECHHHHEWGKICAEVRNKISENIASYLYQEGKLNWNSRQPT